MYYYTIAIVLIALGFALLFFIDNIIQPNTQNATLKCIRDNNTIIGLACLGSGYYAYTLCESKKVNNSKLVEMSDVDNLPSYEDSISTDKVLNM